MQKIGVLVGQKWTAFQQNAIKQGMQIQALESVANLEGVGATVIAECRMQRLVDIRDEMHNEPQRLAACRARGAAITQNASVVIDGGDDAFAIGAIAFRHVVTGISPREVDEMQAGGPAISGQVTHLISPRRNQDEVGSDFIPE